MSRNVQPAQSFGTVGDSREAITPVPVAHQFASLIETSRGIVFEYRFEPPAFTHLLPTAADILVGDANQSLLEHLIFNGTPTHGPATDRVAWRRADGRVVWAEHSAWPLAIDGAVVGLYGWVRDITTQVNAEEELARKNQLLQGILDGAPDAIFVKDAQLRYTIVNHAAENLLGLSAADAIGKTVEDLLDAERAIEMMRMDTAALSSKSPTSMEFAIIAPSGEERIQSITKSVLRSSDNTIEALISIARDITDIKRSESILRNSELFVRAILDSLAAEIAILDYDGTISATNQAWDLAMDAVYSASYGIGDNYFDFLTTVAAPADGAPASIHKLMDAVAKGETSFGNTDLQVNCGPFHRWISLRLFRMSGGAGANIVAVHEDISDRKAADDELHEAHSLAQAASRAKSEFLSRMSHELRTPLNAILGFAQLLEMSEIPGTGKADVTQILKAGRHLLNLINEILDISRIEAGRLGLSPEPVLLREAISESVDLLRSLAAERQVEIHIDSRSDLDHSVVADKQRLKQILLNLLGNAIKFNRVGGTVDVSIATHGQAAMSIAITDSGYGIAPDKLPRVFDPFERLDAESSGEEGTGLGLAVAARLAEAMHGSITAASTLGVGSTFSVRLPRAADNLPAAPLAPSVDNDVATGVLSEISGRVLYIEDNDGNRQLMKRVVDQFAGITFEMAATGAEGLAAVTNLPTDVILLDLNLPDMSGRDVLREIKTNPSTRHIPVVIVTASVMKPIQRELQAMGAISVFAKPIAIPEMTAELMKLLEMKEIDTRD
ncbi:MAG TPA: PAS domain S-box protein [Capsulimonadaceae bacterium]|jgi:PAS domain S-box-containing protein